MKFKLLILFSLIINAMLLDYGRAQISEDRLKAIFVERFTRFVEWPVSAQLADTSKPFIVGVYGDGKFRSTLKSAYTNQEIKTHRVLIRSLQDPSEIKGCHLIYVPDDVEKDVPEIVKEAQKNAVLTIGDSANGFEKGLIICFYTENKKIRFKVNKESAEKSGLTIDYRLLGKGR